MISLDKLNCDYHAVDLKQCLDCIELLVSSNALKQEHANLTSMLSNSNLVLAKLREKAELLEQRLRDFEGQKNFHLPPVMLKVQNPILYYKSIDLPSSFFDITKDPEYSLAFMLRAGMLPSEATCSECKSGRGEPLQMTMNLSESKSHMFVCPSCEESKSITDGTFWHNTRMSFDRILMFIFLYALGLKDSSIAHFVKEGREVKLLCKALRQIVAEEYVANLPKFSGIVEIDESHFFHTTGAELKSWVFGLFERHTRRTYMQCVAKRDAATLLPIIMGRCEVGTTIISDQWKAYDKLEDLGYPHYTVDHSRFFVDPQNREIHSQNIEISWGWAKYEIKRKNRAGVNLQDYLHEFCWRRVFKCKEKTMEHAEILKALIQLTIKHPCPKIDL